ncbi:radical SAM protein, partial [Eubacteriales bacterium DFI.9.88]|nr:radical SAM protein [Eubacteriales bacterium DFI.9.88]
PMDRYSRITEKNPRETVLLRGSGCKWRRCRFCDYHLDFSSDEKANYRLNKQVLGQVEGIYSSMEVINSGSFCDLDEESIGEILQVCKDKTISRIHLECHWRDRETLSQFRSFFGEHGIQVTVKMGEETFDEVFRDGVLQKGMDH